MNDIDDGQPISGNLRGLLRQSRPYASYENCKANGSGSNGSNYPLQSTALVSSPDCSHRMGDSLTTLYMLDLLSLPNQPYSVGSPFEFNGDLVATAEAESNTGITKK